MSETNGDDVRGRSIIVTGAGRGIGRGIAHHLARCGASVVVGEYVPRRLERIVGELTDIGGDNLGRLCDVRRRTDIEDLVAATADRFGRVDAIVNNAVTYGGPGPLVDITEAQMDDVYTSGVKATLWGMQAVYPHMPRQGGAESSMWDQGPASSGFPASARTRPPRRPSEP